MATLAQRAASDVRADLHRRLQARRPEIEQALLNRIFALADPAEAAELEYTEGLRGSVVAALDYGLAAVRFGAERAPAMPAPLLTQARIAARNGIGLDTVLRRYFAGYMLLTDFLLEEARQAGFSGGTALQPLMRSLAALFDRLVMTVSEEHSREARGVPASSARRRAAHVKRLLDGELLDTSDLGYGFDVFHLGAIATGSGAAEAIRHLVAPLDCRLLLVEREEEAVWAWLGSRSRIDPAALDPSASSGWPAGVALALGEPGQGLAGWRLTHHQARAALPIALRSPRTSIRYADVALISSMLQDDLLATSLRALYLAPLERGRDGGKVAQETLRAYFSAERNVSSAAVALGVNRNTVASRLRAIEMSIGVPLASRAADMEAALRLEELAEPSASPISSAVC